MAFEVFPLTPQSLHYCHSYRGKLCYFSLAQFLLSLNVLNGLKITHVGDKILIGSIIGASDVEVKIVGNR